MIYTTDLSKDTTHILVYDNTTPICVIELSISKDDYLLLHKTWEEQWIEYVQKILDNLAKVRGLNPKNLNARPFEFLLDNEQWRYENE